jgi:hypothetical protein
MLWSSHLFADLSTSISFDPGLVCAGPVGEQLAAGQIFLRVLRLFLSASSHQNFVLILLPPARRGVVILVTDSVVK